jgi:hypothetical protein
MYNIFFLGAGFSRSAGLPLGDGLWTEVLEIAKSKGLYEKNLEYAIYEYLDYYNGTTGEKINEDEINLEKFMSYLDIDRQLLLKGGDYTAPEEPLKNLIAYVLHNHERKMSDEQFEIYERFAEHLGAYDIIFTFNYDTVLEKALKRKNIPHRLYPFRHKYDEKTKSLILDGREEVTILKMHGSINWFDKSYYQEWKDSWLQRGYKREPPFAVFDGRMDNEIHQLLDEPFPQNDSLKNIYIIENLERYFQIYFWYDKGRISDSPFIIPPSYHKLMSLSYLGNFWGGFTNSIIGPNRIAIIGFSFPQHDEYVRQPLYWYIKNFYRHGEPISGKKAKLKIIDLKDNQKDIDNFKINYRFVDEKWTDFYFGGLCEEALDVIFSEE